MRTDIPIHSEHGILSQFMHLFALSPPAAFPCCVCCKIQTAKALERGGRGGGGGDPRQAGSQGGNEQQLLIYRARDPHT
jgi:hypothetical protein